MCKIVIKIIGHFLQRAVPKQFFPVLINNLFIFQRTECIEVTNTQLSPTQAYSQGMALVPTQQVSCIRLRGKEKKNFVIKNLNIILLLQDGTADGEEEDEMIPLT